MSPGEGHVRALSRREAFCAARHSGPFSSVPVSLKNMSSKKKGKKR